jgi:hypothetical protein
VVIVTVIDRQADDSERVVSDAVRELVAELHAYTPPAARLDSDLERDPGSTAWHNHASWADGIVLAATIPGRLHFVAGEVVPRRN